MNMEQKLYGDENRNVEIRFSSPEERMLVDGAWHIIGQNKTVIKIGDECWLYDTKSMKRTRKVSKEWFDLQHETLMQWQDYEYPMYWLEKKSGYEARTLGRAITQQEFECLKARLKIPKVTALHTVSVGGYYGGQYLQNYDAVQIVLDGGSAIEVADKLQQNGIEAHCDAADRVSIRVDPGDGYWGGGRYFEDSVKQD